MEKQLYYGYQYFDLTDEEMAAFYENKLSLSNLKENEYVLVRDMDGKICDKYCYQDGSLQKLNWKPIHNNHGPIIKPKNLEQELALDMLEDKTIPVKALTGSFGVGKDFLMINAALNRLEEGDFDKLIWVRNNIEVKGTEKLGALPGDVYDKVINFAMPLADHLGGIEALDMFIDRNQIEVAHLGFMRGRDLKHSLVYVSEAENLTTKLCQVLISRLSEGSELWVNGDYKQSDRRLFEEDNGLVKMVNRLTGNRLFGHVHLTQSVRSPQASLADLLD